MNNHQVVQAFCGHKTGYSANLSSDGLRLWSYQTVIAQWNKNTLTIDIARFSVSTSKHQSLIPKTGAQIVCLGRRGQSHLLDSDTVAWNAYAGMSKTERVELFSRKGVSA